MVGVSNTSPELKEKSLKIEYPLYTHTPYCEKQTHNGFGRVGIDPNVIFVIVKACLTDNVFQLKIKHIFII